MQFTPEQQLENIRLAARLWVDRVEPRDVVKGLDVWVCGTQACFGGHLAAWPEFRALGVLVGPYGRPTTVWNLDAHETAWALFGDEDLFAEAGDHPADGEVEDFGYSDHELVLARLDYAESCLRGRIEHTKLTGAQE